MLFNQAFRTAVSNATRLTIEAKSNVVTDLTEKIIYNRRILRYAQFGMLTSGTVLLSFYAIALIDGQVGKAQALKAFEQSTLTSRSQVVNSPKDPSLSEQAATTLADVDGPDQSNWAPGRIAAYEESLSDTSTMPMAILSIPELALRVPIFQGTGELALNRGVGLIEGTASVDDARGNIGIAGHRDGYFRKLKDIQLNDRIELTTKQGNAIYRVAELSIVEPTDVYVLDPTLEHSITLVTCYPFFFVGSAPQRFIVRAVEIGQSETQRETG